MVAAPARAASLPPGLTKRAEPGALRLPWWRAARGDWVLGLYNSSLVEILAISGDCNRPGIRRAGGEFPAGDGGSAGVAAD